MKDDNNIFEKVAGLLKTYQSSGLETNVVSKKYFNISYSTDTKIIGKKFPQVDYIDLKLAHSLKFHSLLDINTVFDKIELHKSSKQTDFISTLAISANAFILSEKAIEIFKAYNLGEHKIYNATVYHNGKRHKYFVLHFLNDLKENIDFSNSEFMVTDIFGRHLSDIAINDIADYQSKKELIKSGNFNGLDKWSIIKIKNGVFKNQNNNPDIFTLEFSSIDKFISVELKEAIASNNLTGYTISDVKNIKE